MLHGAAPSGVPYTGPRATYLVLCCISSLALTMLLSLWHGSFSGVVAVVALNAVYIGSSELLALYGLLAPASLVVDLVWIAIDHKTHHSGHGWLVFFTLIDMLTKVLHPSSLVLPS